MLDFFKQRPLVKFWPLSIITLLLGAYFATNQILPGILVYFVFLFFGGLSLYLQYGKGVLRAAFSFPKQNSWKWLIPVILVTLVLSFFFSFVGSLLGQPLAENSALGTGTLHQKSIRILWICLSLIGEELITAALTFPFYSLLNKKIQSKHALLLATLIGALLFGMLHFKVYHWNLYQMLVTTGLGRLPLTWLWFKADSLWPASIAHILYDLILFIPMLLA